MSNWAIALMVFGVTAGSSFTLVGRCIPLFRQLGLMDPVNPRKIHRTPLPRGAGVAMFLAFLVGIALTYLLDVQRFAVETERLLLLLIGATIVVTIMLVDDAVGLNPTVKLAWQVGAALIVVAPRLRGIGHGIVIEQFNAPHFGQVHVPLGLAVAFTIFWIVGMMNTLNWVDGLDGLAASVTLVACTILFLHTYFWPRDDPQFTVSLLPLALGAAVVGFLPFNWNPAKIIMGDSGANFLGYALAVASIIGGAKIATALLALGLPILDVAWVILYRIAHGRSPLKADRGHLHHRLLDSGWSQAQIVIFVSSVSLVAGVASLLLPNRGAKLGAMVLLGLAMLVFIGAIALRDQRRNGRASTDPADSKTLAL
ncbi:MAG: undecaprenyl/decaprenyl-phosphate alpha-N-acetylglucosaminyl 1-phosphate transferase [Thermomicrobiales bacterium]|nr:undecaprenyl/decaprenyl-phosphate alpha-N-acetylglucosaminyl 1-phosphate transferase [Thermomicrobiales bacterium]